MRYARLITLLLSLFSVPGWAARPREAVDEFLKFYGGIYCPQILAANRPYIGEEALKRGQQFNSGFTQQPPRLLYAQDWLPPETGKWIISYYVEGDRGKFRVEASHEYFQPRGLRAPGIIDESNGLLLPHERPIADYLRSMYGADLIKVPEYKALPGSDGKVSRREDVLVIFHTIVPLSLPTEFKRPEPLDIPPGATEAEKLDIGSGKIRNMVRASIVGGGQAADIVIDARGTGLTREMAFRGALRIAGHLRKLVFEEGYVYYLLRLNVLRIVGDGFEYLFIYKPSIS